MKKICVFTGAASGINPLYKDAAYQMGQMIGSQGLGLVYGGGKMGLMGEVIRVDGDVAFGDAERLGDILAGAAGALHWRPDIRLVALDVGDRDRRLHGDMGEMREVVLADDDLVGALQRTVRIALLAQHEARLA